MVGVSDDDVTVEGAPFLVTDLLEGETAEARRRKAGGRLDVAAVMFLAEEVLGALTPTPAKGMGINGFPSVQFATRHTSLPYWQRAERWKQTVGWRLMSDNDVAHLGG